MVSVNVSQKLASLEWLVLHDGIDDPKKTEFLMALDGAKERLHLFQANLLEEGSNDAIVDGCEGVLHTASPVQLSVSNPQVLAVSLLPLRMAESKAESGCRGKGYVSLADRNTHWWNGIV
nr:putative anthocyanidin reductase [Coffea arabica]